MSDIQTIHSFVCDLQAGPLEVQLHGIMQQDALADVFRVSVYRAGKEISLKGMTVRGYLCIASTRQMLLLEGSITDNCACVALTSACYDVPGYASLCVQLQQGDVRHTLVKANFCIGSTRMEHVVDPEHVIPSLAELLGQIAAMEQATDAAVGAAEFATASGQQAYLLAQQATVGLTTQVNERLRRIAPPVIPEAAGDGVIVLTDSSENSFDRLSIFGRTTQEGTPSPDNPVEMVNIGTKGNIGLMVRGKNLLKNIATSGAWNGISFTVNEDGCVRLTGTATQLFALNITEAGFIPAGNYKLLPARAGANERAYVDVIAGGVQVAQARVAQTISFTIKEGDNAYARIIVPEGETIDAVLYPVIYSASVTDLGFEPFRDGGSMTIIPPDEMRGIPVYSGGNYTDANGQQWICDEIDLARGVYVQRIAVQILDGKQPATLYETTDEWTRFNYENLQGIPGSGIMCDQYPQRPVDWQLPAADTVEMHGTQGYVIFRVSGKYTLEEWNARLDQSAVWIIYAMREPIETPLTDDEMAAAIALKSLYPNTTIINDEGAGMAVAYVADTKLYIDNKFAALAAASIDQ